MISADRDGDFNFPILIPLATALLGWIAYSELARGHWSSAIVWIALPFALAFLGAAVFILREQIREDRLRDWLFRSADEIWASGVMRDGVLVRPDTELVVFPVTVSLVVLRMRVPTCPLLAGSSPGATKLGALLTTATTGWWSLGGILRTPLDIAVCLRGGERCTVSDYMEQLQKDGVTSQWLRAQGRR
jgi:hypothetical protein